MAQVTRDGFEYELTVSLELDVNHFAVTSKDRTRLFEGKPSFIPSEETGRMLKEWCEDGIDEHKQCLEDIDKCKNMAEVDALIAKYDSLLITNEAGKRVFPADIAQKLRNKVESFKKS